MTDKREPVYGRMEGACSSAMTLSEKDDVCDYCKHTAIEHRGFRRYHKLGEFAAPAQPNVVPGSAADDLNRPRPTPEEIKNLLEDPFVRPEPQPNAEGVKFDRGKPRYDLLPFVALEETVKVLTYGATKYSPDNWRKVERWRYVSAAFRHLIALSRGETHDPETGLHHGAHLACCAMFLIELPE